MGEILTLAEALWKGEKDVYTHHPFSPPYGLEEVAEETWFYKGFSNTVVRNTPAGLVLIDPGSFWDARMRFNAIRARLDQPLHTAVFTHGHTDHVFGVDIYENEAAAKGCPRPRVAAHKAIETRFRRYQESAGWNSIINSRQFRGGAGIGAWPTEYRMPDILYENRLFLTVGGVGVQLRYARGETDDHTWVFFPDNRILATGDLIIWGVPNAGNPQKVQRYTREWAQALREMASLEPAMLLPGHGLPVIGTGRVRRVLDDTAAFLERLHDQTLELMNRGASLDEILHTVKGPADLLAKPYLKPVYDEPEFIVRNIWRWYGGWYDGTPSHLKPASEESLGREIARLAGSAGSLAARAEALSAAGEHRLACHLADWAFKVAPEDGGVKEAVHKVYTARAMTEPSTMAMGIFLAAARETGIVPEEEPGMIFALQEEQGRKRTQK